MMKDTFSLAICELKSMTSSCSKKKAPEGSTMMMRCKSVCWFKTSSVKNPKFSAIKGFFLLKYKNNEYIVTLWDWENYVTIGRALFVNENIWQEGKPFEVSDKSFVGIMSFFGATHGDPRNKKCLKGCCSPVSEDGKLMTVFKYEINTSEKYDIIIYKKDFINKESFKVNKIDKAL